MCKPAMNATQNVPMYAETDQDFSALWNAATLDTQSAIGVMRLAERHLLESIPLYCIEDVDKRSIISRELGYCRAALETALPLLEKTAELLVEYENFVVLKSARTGLHKAEEAVSARLHELMSEYEFSLDAAKEAGRALDDEPETLGKSNAYGQHEKAMRNFNQVEEALSWYQPRNAAELRAKADFVLKQRDRGLMSGERFTPFLMALGGFGRRANKY